MSYWIFSVAIVVLGFLGGFSIGPVVIPIGIALLVLGPVRHRPRLYWPGLVAVIGFEVGFVLYAPLVCTATGSVGGPTETVCATILGPEYRGVGYYNPSLEPARAVGAVVGIVAAAAALVFVRIAERRAP
jgi:hypothetical protein